jgi:hypothetical protein
LKPPVKFSSSADRLHIIIVEYILQKVKGVITYGGK